MQTPSPPAAATVVAALWRTLGLADAALERLHLSGVEPMLTSSFAVGTVLQASLAGAALAATEVGRARGGVAQAVSIDGLDAARESAARFSLDGRTPPTWDKISGIYRCGGDAHPGWVRIHANFAHHRDGALALLGLPPGAQTERDAVSAALQSWRAEDFESAAAERGLVVAAVRTPEQWQAHAQAAALASLPLVDVQRIEGCADVAPLPWPDGPAANALPLRGLRVLELTRILAGPVAGRTLAAWGADVMLVNSPNLPNIENIADTSRGKLSVHVDLRSAAGRDTLRALVRECDVFVQGYRPGGIAGLGFGAAELARLKPGIVAVSLSAYGHAGPWAQRRGFDSLVQSATGLNMAEAAAFGETQPRALPLQALDYGTGYLLALGALTALLRQRGSGRVGVGGMGGMVGMGGSWQVRVALAGVGHWLTSLGRVADGPRAPKLGFDGAMEITPSGFGELAAVRHAVRFSHSQPGWSRPSMPPGTHAAAWPPRPV